jgi:cyclophilin family peptidyl-prolyl cis-trans isomerase
MARRRLSSQLFYDVAPKTAENFRALCTGNVHFICIKISSVIIHVFAELGHFFFSFKNFHIDHHHCSSIIN